eukprot:TRINITY_DN74821_c0_g1_i1.p1 TRINITY_DN74821_c0_g1~~TRINITY_DN74821_c0_g1_i1.p1  ORF type:complete len:592 (-),score=65.10 TRINITY_DN74821_c0_g1_i1:513-2084(-)
MPAGDTVIERKTRRVVTEVYNDGSQQTTQPRGNPRSEKHRHRHQPRHQSDASPPPLRPDVSPIPSVSPSSPFATQSMYSPRSAASPVNTVEKRGRPTEVRSPYQAHQAPPRTAVSPEGKNVELDAVKRTLSTTQCDLRRNDQTLEAIAQQSDSVLSGLNRLLANLREAQQEVPRSESPERAKYYPQYHAVQPPPMPQETVSPRRDYRDTISTHSRLNSKTNHRTSDHTAPTTHAFSPPAHTTRHHHHHEGYSQQDFSSPTTHQYQPSSYHNTNSPRLTCSSPEILEQVRGSSYTASTPVLRTPARGTHGGISSRDDGYDPYAQGMSPGGPGRDVRKRVEARQQSPPAPVTHYQPPAALPSSDFWPTQQTSPEEDAAQTTGNGAAQDVVGPLDASFGYGQHPGREAVMEREVPQSPPVGVTPLMATTIVASPSRRPLGEEMDDGRTSPPALPALVSDHESPRASPRRSRYTGEYDANAVFPHQPRWSTNRHDSENLKEYYPAQFQNIKERRTESPRFVEQQYVA